MKTAPRIVVLLALAGCGPAQELPKPGATSFHYKIDATVSHPADRNGCPLEAVRDVDGRTSLFIANELILNTSSAADADALAAKLGGKVVRSDVVPEPPATLGIKLDAQYLAPTQFLIQLDPEKADLSSFEADADAAKLAGESAISSERGAKTLALITHQRAQGLKVSPNFVGTQSLITTSAEHPSGGGFYDPFTDFPYTATGSRTNVAQAWQLVQSAGGFTRVNVAIIDDGFWFDATGKPMSTQTPWVSDLPEHPTQYDFARDGYIVSGPNRNTCTGGSGCPWHGNGSAGTALGTMNNMYGGAGTGALVADPFIFSSEISWDQIARAIRTSVAWHASVISMSFGGECDNVFCDGYFEFNLYPALRNARDNAVVAVAAAGNDGQDTHSVPCKGDGVICVGALADGTNNAIGYSNFGRYLDIWAPTDINVLPAGDTPPGQPGFHNGTSASCPFVAGVVAMLKAYDGSLTSDQVTSILQRTAWTDSTDPKVHHSINAYRALRMVATGADATPELTITAPHSAQLHRMVNVRTHTNDLEEGSPCCTLTWTPAPTFHPDSGREATFVFDTLGDHLVQATATDRHGHSVSATVTIHVENTAPVVTMLHPTVTDALFVGLPAQLSASATDFNETPAALPCAQLTWTSDNAADTQFPLHGCELSTTFATQGSRTLRVTAADPQGLTAAVGIILLVGAAPTNYPPVVTVSAIPPPEYNNDGFGWDWQFDFTATATDPEGNTPLTYQWKMTSYAPNSTFVVYGSTTLISTSLDLHWKASTANPAWFGAFSDVGNACYSGQLVKLELVVTDSLGHVTHRVVADPGITALPKLKLYRCILG